MSDENFHTIKVRHDTASPLVHQIKSSNSSYYKSILVGAVIVVLGIVSGYLLAGKVGNKLPVSVSGGTETENNVVVGSSDTKTFSDSAEGELVKGGINGEGTHRLIRPGGESQTVALTSSVLDLSQFEDKKVRVWGETFAAQTAGWLMDVGKVELLE